MLVNVLIKDRTGLLKPNDKERLVDEARKVLRRVKSHSEDSSELIINIKGSSEESDKKLLIVKTHFSTSRGDLYSEAEGYDLTTTVVDAVEGIEKQLRE